MAGNDDLDAFFDEVSEVEAKAVQDDDGKPAPEETKHEEAAAEPPAKKIKTGPAVRPRGVVVASSTSVVMAAKEREEKEAELEASQQQLQHPAIMPPMGRNLPGPATASIGPSFPGANPAISSNSCKNKGPKAAVRMAAGKKWVDQTLDEWPDNDFRIFVGNLSNEVSDTVLFQHFSKYPSLAKAKVIRDTKNPEKSKGYGFVSLLDPLECARALREMDQTWLCSRPIRIKRSDWKERDFKVVKKREKKEKKQQKRMGLRI